MSSPKVLEDAIEGLYTAFANYALAEHTNPCPGCHSPGADDLLHEEPLRKLGWKHLREYAKHALMVWGDLDDFKHFLPRIFDLLLNAPDWKDRSPSPESVFHKFCYGEWRTWPRQEQAAVESLLQAVWQTVLSNPPTGYIDVELWLCCISQCEDDLDSYLNQWMKDERLPSCWALSSLILASSIAYINTTHRNAHWKRCEAQYAQLQEWVKSRAVIEKLHRAAIGCENRDIAREFATAQLCALEARSLEFKVLYRDRPFQTAYKGLYPTYRLY